MVRPPNFRFCRRNFTFLRLSFLTYTVLFDAFLIRHSFPSSNVILIDICVHLMLSSGVSIVVEFSSNQRNQSPSFSLRCLYSVKTYLLIVQTDLSTIYANLQQTIYNTAFFILHFIQAQSTADESKHISKQPEN